MLGVLALSDRQQTEGRLLKLVSGTMMLGLGILLIAAPAALNDLRVARGLLVGSIGLCRGSIG
ncbi:MAG: hypothetical protein IPK02_06815 [Candidatus Accumulibacter sp.]|uniref:Uncharacterized protein n=1 Tax=Candidatus Accumulibacter affinis TaxID=2954384 RepID=A0A935T7P9_9PROT|nr:hypothetical protein [Candidatus Accumulibacter affinis]